MIFSEWFDEFFFTYCEGVVTYECGQEYKAINSKHYYPIADMELDSIKPMHAQKCMNTASEYSSSRQRKVYFLLKRCFNEAIVNDYATKNPVEKLKPTRRIFKEPVLLTKEQIRKLFEVENEVTLLYEFELWTGLRRGEVLALTWNNVNFSDGYINVCQSLVSAKGHAVIRPYTKSGRDRLVSLCSESIRILNAVKTIDNVTSSYVFHNNTGNFISFRAYHDRYKAFYKERQEKYPDIPYMTPHKLRHSYASYMNQSGADIETLRKLLGHSSISTTSIYVHSSFDQMKRAADKLKFT